MFWLATRAFCPLEFSALVPQEKVILLANQINNQGIIPSTDVTQLTLTLKMTTAQVVETSVTVNNNSPIQDYVHPDDQTQPFEMTPGFKPFTDKSFIDRACTVKIAEHYPLFFCVFVPDFVSVR